MVFFDLDRPSGADLAAEVGDGTSADVLMTPIRWLQHSMLEAPFESRVAGEPLDDSALLALLKKPNPEYPTEVLLAGTVLSYSIDGNAYWIIARNAAGEPVELWYAPHTVMEPKWPTDRNDVFISHYEYGVAGQVQNLMPEDVVHFREGVDLDNIRKGLSPLKGLLREIWTDNEAANFTAALLKNNGIPGVVVSPAASDVTITPKEADAAKARIETGFSRSNRGRPLVMTGATKVEQFGFSPKELDLSPLRDISEERVTAALGIPAAVVGFGSGLNATKVGATMTEMRKMAWFNGVIPMQRTIGGEVTRSLSPAFRRREEIGFDITGVEALRENEDTKANRLGRLFRDGVITRAEARGPLGMEVDEGDKVYAVAMTQAFIPQGSLAAGLVPTATLTGSRTRSANVTGVVDPDGANGNGKQLVHQAALHAGKKKAALLEAGIKQILATTGVLPTYWVAPDGEYLKQHQHSPNEMAIIDAAPSAPATPAATTAARLLDRIKRNAASMFQAPLEAVFEDLGQSALESSRRAIEAAELTTAGDHRPAEVKQSAEQIAMAQAIIDGIDIAATERALQEALAAGYLEVSVQVTDAVAEAFGIDFELEDAAQAQVMNEGGLRAGLIDLDQQTRDAVFDGLESGIEEGLRGDGLARHIAGSVEAGPWRDVITRARVISRTEGANAANTSTLEAAKQMDETEHVQVFDNRSGFDDPVCSRANGSILTIEQAEAIGLAHPNCTRSFVPINALLMAEMEISGPMSRIDPEQLQQQQGEGSA